MILTDFGYEKVDRLTFILTNANIEEFLSAGN